MMNLTRLCQNVVLMAGVGALALIRPAQAEIALTGAQIQAFSNQVELLSPTGSRRPANQNDCLCRGDLINTQASAQADLLFNDGSLVRLGELSQFSFRPQTRQLQVSQGTALFFVPLTPGRLLVQTPNGIVGIQNNVAVVRYVSSSDLTLVMALATSNSGSVSITARTQPQQELVLTGGQMAFIKTDAVEVVEFDLLEFYETSRLMQGLKPGANSPIEPGYDSVAALQPALLAAIQQQSSFVGHSPILDPATISVRSEPTGLFGQETGSAPVLPAFVSEEIRRYDDAPPGVITPLPEISDSEAVQKEPPVPSTSPIESTPVESTQSTGEGGDFP